MLKQKHAAAAALLMAAAAAMLCIPVQGAAAESYADEVVTLVNAERAAAGLAPVYAVPVLHDAAAVRAAETVTSFSHTRPDGRSCSTVLNDAGISWRMTGENIAYGYATPEAVVDGWMHSEGHRANILGDFDYIGVGVTEQNGTLYWAQVFTGGAVLDGAYLPGETAAPEPVTEPEPTEPQFSTDEQAPVENLEPTEASTNSCTEGDCGKPFTLCIGDVCPVYTCTDGNCTDPLQMLLSCLGGKGCGGLNGLFGCRK